MSKIDSVLTIVTELSAKQAAMQQWQETTHERIFGGQQPGMVQYLHVADEKLSEALTKSNKELTDALSALKSSMTLEIGNVKTDIVEIRTEKRVTKAYAAGAIGLGTTIGYLIKSGFIKLATMKFGG